MFFLILKKTSSPVDVKTYESNTAGEKDARLKQQFSAFIGRIVSLACRKGGRTLMLIGKAPSSCLVTDSLFCSVSDMMRGLSVEVDEFKYQGTPSATAMVAEGERRIGLG